MNGKGFYDPDEAYRRGYEEGINMFMKDPKGYRAYIDTIPKESPLYRGLIDGKQSAIEAMKNMNHAYHVENNHEMGFKMGYALKNDPKEYDRTLAIMKQRGGGMLEGYQQGGRLYEIDQKRLIQKAEAEAKKIEKKQGRKR